MKYLVRFIGISLLIVMAPVISAQPDSCPQIVEDVLQSMAQVCNETGRNQVCYGNLLIQAEFQPDAAAIQFEQVGDLANVNAFQSLDLSPINGDTSEWGVALMRLQASLPNTIPGQNVTFVLFGDVEMTSAVNPDSSANPMQAFYFSTGIGSIGCEEAPPNGLLIQTPEGAGQVTFAMNGMDFSLGSSAFIQAVPGSTMQVSMLDGAGALQVGEETIPALAGSTVTLPLNEELMVEQEYEITAFDTETVQSLPLGFLDEDQFELADPLDEDTISQLMANLEAEQPICGEGTPWDCAELPWLLGGESCPLDEDGNPDCELSGFRWGDEGFGSEAFESDGPTSGAAIQPQDGQWTQTSVNVTASAGCPGQIATAIEANTTLFSSQSVVFPRPFDFEQFLRTTQDALPPEVAVSNPEPNVYQLDFSQEGIVALYTIEIVSETEVSARLEFDMSAAGLDCTIVWETVGVHSE